MTEVEFVGLIIGDDNQIAYIQGRSISGDEIVEVDDVNFYLTCDEVRECSSIERRNGKLFVKYKNLHKCFKPPFKVILKRDNEMKVRKVISPETLQ